MGIMDGSSPEFPGGVVPDPVLRCCGGGSSSDSLMVVIRSASVGARVGSVRIVPMLMFRVLWVPLGSCGFPCFCVCVFVGESSEHGTLFGSPSCGFTLKKGLGDSVCESLSSHRPKGFVVLGLVVVGVDLVCVSAPCCWIVSLSVSPIVLVLCSTRVSL